MPLNSCNSKSDQGRKIAVKYMEEEGETRQKKLNYYLYQLKAAMQGRRGPPGHREIVPVAPENHADMGPLKLS